MSRSPTTTGQSQDAVVSAYNREADPFHEARNNWTYMTSKQLTDFALLDAADVDDARVLNVGCFHPIDEIMYAHRVRSWVATDLGARTVAVAEEVAKASLSADLFSRLEFRVADGTDLPFRDGEFDVAVSMSTIDHVVDHEARQQFVAEMARVTRAGGRVGALEWLPRFAVSTTDSDLADRYNEVYRQAVCNYHACSNLERYLHEAGLIEVRTRTLVTAADAAAVTLSDGSVVGARTIVWSAGVRPNDPTEDPSLARFRNGRIQVDVCLRILGRNRAYALGDVASPGPATAPLPMLSPPAMQGGRYIANAILEELRTGHPPERPFRYVDKGTMATIGRNAGVARLPGGLEITGFLGWMTWLFVHVYYLIGFRNRISALAAWAWDYVRFDRPIRIILEARGSKDSS